jgi:hypothetical protein
MKTAQVMQRNVLGVEFEQNHKNEKVNITKFIKSLESIGSNSPLEGELEVLDATKDFTRLDKYLANVKTVALMKELALEEVIDVKDLTLTKRGKYGGTWVHPLIFVDYLMWISPKFHVAGLKLIYDNVLKYRDLGGDAFKVLNDTIKANIAELPGWGYAHVSKLVGEHLQIPAIIVGHKVTYDWNNATELQLKMRHDAMSSICTLLEIGQIGNFNQLQTLSPAVIRNIYKRNNS